MSRKVTVSRKTGETDITITLDLDGSGVCKADTGIGFLDHMFCGFAKHGYFDLEVSVKGDLEIDGHHSVEDCGIVFGEAIAKAVGNKAGINRFGYFILPMDEALVLCSVDLCGRPYYASNADFTVPMVGELDTQLVKEFFYSVSYGAMMNLHFDVMRGENAHHIIEAMFKAFGKSLDMAVKYDERCKGIPSTKGSLGD
ncbi:MAG: imidazoleglycerol-phosphate dehydratase HisB [Lachnospiraceae bacterium]|nr:imidazoleglycerol-phosphate dehydratase HisB [Lachnospiraceae bacterium]